jgi:transcriptional regulator with XRE-family HTH domain
MVKSIGDQTTARERRKLLWAEKLRDQLGFFGWSTKRFVYELNEAGCDVTRQAVEQWLAGKSSPSPENQAYVAKVLRSSPHLLFPVEAA